MASDKYPNSGILFRNDRKRDNPKAPDYQGSANIETDGETVEYRLSAWIKEGKKGKFLSLSFKVKDGDYSSHRSAPSNDDDSDIPF